MKVIRKYVLTDGTVTVSVPADAEVVSVGQDETGQRCVWMHHSPGQGTENHQFVLQRTDVLISNDKWMPVGTIIDRELAAWHVLQFLA